MKKIEAIIRKSKFTEVKQALNNVDVNFFSYRDVIGLSNEIAANTYRGVTYNTAAIERLYLTIVVNDEFEQITIDTILKFAQTGKIGDGRIIVSTINESYRIRTQEKGSISLK